MDRSPIQVLQVIRSIDSSTGGPAFAVAQMTKVLSAREVSVDVVTTVPANGNKAKPPITAQIIQNGGRCFHFPKQIGKTWSFSLQLWSWLKKNVQNYDVVHITGVFTFPVLIGAREARKAGVPYIVRPAGTLDVYPLAQKAWRKRIYYWLFIKGILNGASAIHVTSESERKQLALLGIEDKCVVVPLSVMIPEPTQVERKADRDLSLLFLSRIHSKKGLPVLIEALSILRQRGISATLTIAGDGSRAYLSEIKCLIREFELSDVVHFAGFVEGQEKTRLLGEADIFVLPSYQENFGIAVAEAMAAGLPVIVSDQVAIADEIMENNAGVVIPVDMPEVLADKILTFLDPEYLKQMSTRAREFVKSRFSADRQGQQLVHLYTKIISDL